MAPEDFPHLLRLLGDTPYEPSRSAIAEPAIYAIILESAMQESTRTRKGGYSKIEL